MKMALDDAAGVNVIRSYRPGEVQIRERCLRTSLIVLPHRLLEDWRPPRVDALRPEHLEPVLAHAPEILILGTGDTQVFPDPAVFGGLMAAGIGFEVMANAAACRTYNVLVAEERRAALALILADEAM